LNAEGNTPVDREELMICITATLSVEEIVCRRLDGIGSGEQVVNRYSSISLETVIDSPKDFPK